jgi:hypothetical protein
MGTPSKDPRERRSKVVLKDHGQLTSTTTIKLFKATKRIRIDRVDYINPTGLVADNTNAFRGEIKNGSTLVCALFNTDGDDVPAGASLAADTFVTGTNGTAANRTLAKDDVLSLVFTEDGAATLPAGTVVIYYTELN